MIDLNFDTYEIMRLAEMPKVETVIVPTYDFWGGVGEPTICVVAPAVLNAIHRGDRQAGAQPAAEEREAGVSESVPRVVLPSPCGRGWRAERAGVGGRPDARMHPHPASPRSPTLAASGEGVHRARLIQPQLFNTTHAPPAFCRRVQISVAASRVAAGMRTR